MILVPRFKEIIVPIRHCIGVRGRYRIETQAPGRPRRLRAEFTNLITNNGLDLLSSAGNWASTCAVGSGNTAPANTDTALVALVGSTTTINGATSTIQPSSPYYGAVTIVYNFAAGVATGNLAEVGVGSATNSLMSRALILDGGGSPTTITVLSSESLYVTFILQQYPPLTDVTGTISISGTSYGYTLRAANVTSNQWELGGNASPTINNAAAFSGSIGAITGGPSGTQAGADAVASGGTYTPGSYTQTYTATWNLGSANFSPGITAMQWNLGSRGSFQVGFGTAIPKTGTQILVLDFSNTWAR